MTDRRDHDRAILVITMAEMRIECRGLARGPCDRSPTVFAPWHAAGVLARVEDAVSLSGRWAAARRIRRPCHRRVKRRLFRRTELGTRQTIPRPELSLPFTYQFLFEKLLCLNLCLGGDPAWRPDRRALSSRRFGLPQVSLEPLILFCPGVPRRGQLAPTAS